MSYQSLLRERDQAGAFMRAIGEQKECMFRTHVTLRRTFLTGVIARAGFVALGNAQAKGFQVLYSFQGGNDGAGPTGVVWDNGNLYGTTSTRGPANAGTIFAISVNGVEHVLYAFKGGSDGADPLDGLVKDKSGNSYGVTCGCLRGGFCRTWDGVQAERVNSSMRCRAKP